MEVSIEREVICKGATNNVVFRFSLDLGCLSGKAVVSGLADYSMHITWPGLELKDQVEAALYAVFSRSGDNMTLELDEEEVGLHLEMVEPLVAEIAVLKRNGSPSLAASDFGSIEGGIMRHEGNLAALYLDTKLGDVRGSGFAARALEKGVQLNIGGRQQIEPLVRNSLKIELLAIEAGEVRVAPDIRQNVQGEVGAANIPTRVHKGKDRFGEAGNASPIVVARGSVLAAV